MPGQLARPVLRGPRRSNAPGLPDTLSGSKGGEFAVKALDLGGSVRIEVLDQGGGTTIPALRGTPDSPTAVNGRGLHLVEMLAEDWGSTPYGPGTITWFLVTTEATSPTARDADA